MILARLTRAVREQNWFAVALEFVIVVAGVLLAFQISQLGERQAERSRVEAQTALLHAEMQGNLDRIQANIGYVELANANVRELRTQLAEYTVETDPDRLNQLALSIFSNPTLDIQTLALDQLESMEGRQLLSGTPLESALAEWREAYDTTRDTERNLDSMIGESNAGMRFEGLSVEALVSAFPGTGLIDPVPARFETDWQALSQDRTFAGHAALFSLNLEYLWQLNQRLEAATQAVLTILQDRHAP